MPKMRQSLTCPLSSQQKTNPPKKWNDYQQFARPLKVIWTPPFRKIFEGSTHTHNITNNIWQERLWVLITAHVRNEFSTTPGVPLWCKWIKYSKMHRDTNIMLHVLYMHFNFGSSAVDSEVIWSYGRSTNPPAYPPPGSKGLIAGLIEG